MYVVADFIFTARRNIRKLNLLSAKRNKPPGLKFQKILGPRGESRSYLIYVIMCALTRRLLLFIRAFRCGLRVYRCATLHIGASYVAQGWLSALCYVESQRSWSLLQRRFCRRSPKGQIVGYVRVSTFEQNELRHLEGVRFDRKFLDKASGKDVKRAQLEALLGYVREGDTIICHSMDRLGRNLDELCAVSGIAAPFFRPSYAISIAQSARNNFSMLLISAHQLPLAADVLFA